jgi:ABC-type transport system involved in multi-copper enzyme maturation permease subunit
MAGSFLAEVLKLRKRPAVWVLGGLWLAVVVLFLYLLPALIFALIAANAPPGAETALEQQLSPLTPGNLPPYLLQFLFPGLGTAVALILGALAAGSEYGWGTLKTVLSQRPGRLGVLSRKLLALGALLLLFVLAAFLVGAASGLVVTLLSGASLAPPPAAELLEGLGAGVLILIVWALFGFALATLFKGTALAVGLGLIYAFTIEPVFSGLLDLSESLRGVNGFLLGTNTSALSQAFQTASNPMLTGDFIDPAQSVLVMLIYATVFVLVVALVFRRRDVT